MPPLSHWPDKLLPYHDDRSEVLAHIRERFGVSMDMAGRIFRYASYKGVIRFNRDTRLWCGVEGGAR